MITFKQFVSLNEDADEEKVVDFLKEIKSKCSDFLQQSGDLPLYRGMGWGPISPGYYPAREERTSVDSPDGFNFMFNLMIEAAFGIKDFRYGNLNFATGFIKSAAAYRNVSFIFPAGKMKYLWCGHIPDTYESASTFYNGIEGHTRQLISKHFEFRQLDYAESLFRHLYKEATDDFLESEDSPELLNSLLYKASYDKRVLEWTDEQKKIFFDSFIAAAKRQGEMFENSKNLRTAIKDGVEIMLYDMDGYYALPVRLAAKLYPTVGVSPESPSTSSMTGLIQLYDSILSDINGHGK